MAELKIDNNILTITIRNNNDGKIVEWKINRDGTLLEQEGKLICPLCGGEIKPHYLGAIHRPYKGYAFDFNCKCVNCSHFITFGNPVSKDMFEKLKAFSGKWVKHFDKIVGERLEKLGYW